MLEQTFMNEFLDREEELSLVDGALDTLIESKQLLRTPVIGFYGIYGTGKTMLLNKIIEKCGNKQVQYYEISNGLQNPLQYFRQITSKLNESLDREEPVVVILDDWDIASAEQLREMEALLNKLAEDSNLFIILTSKSKEAFDKMSSLSRKLKRVPLKPLDRKHCDDYVSRAYPNGGPDMCRFVFDWTRGYPVALKVVVNAIRIDGLDPDRKSDRKQLLEVMTDKIINKGFFSDASTDTQKLSELYSLFRVLSVPRRFNLIVLQDIIEKYAPQHKLKATPAYVGFPNKINSILHVLESDEASFHINVTARNIFLLKYSIEQSQEYRSIHTFLADLNKKFVTKVDGLERIRYICEYCYHLAKSEALLEQTQILQEELEQFLALQSPDELLHFYYAFRQDEELREALGKHTQVVITLLRKGFLNLCHKIRDEQRIDYWQRFLLCCSPSNSEQDFVSLLAQVIVRIKQEETLEIVEQLSVVIAGDTILRVTLGNNFEYIDALLRGDSPQER